MPENFYGNLTTPQQPTFVFDKVYSSRYALLQNQNDGVLPGRYALVTYGAAKTVLGYYDSSSKKFYYTYTQNTQVSRQFDNEITPQLHIVYENLLAGSWKTRYYYYLNDAYHVCNMEVNQDLNLPGLNELDPLYTYFNNVFEDIRHSLEPAHNSVFIKLYTKDVGYYYREIASLNEYLPAVECIVDAPFSGGYIEESSHVRLRAPYLLKSGLTYELHITETPLYQIGSTELNLEGLSPTFSVKKTKLSNPETVGFIYTPARYKIYPYNARDINASTIYASAYQDGAEPDTYNMDIHLAVIGNTISDIWDMVYGKKTVTPTSEVVNNGYRVQTWERDTTINSTYETAHGDNAGGKDLDTLRGIANTMLELIGYQGHEQLEDANGRVAFKNLTQEIEYLDRSDPIPEGWTAVYDLSTVRGLLAKGMTVTDQLDQLDAILVSANEELQHIQELVGPELDEETHEPNLDQRTVYGLLHLFQQGYTNMLSLLGDSDDNLNNGDRTIYGIYNALSNISVVDLENRLGPLIGVSQNEPLELMPGEQSIRARLRELEEWRNSLNMQVLSSDNSKVLIIKNNVSIMTDENDTDTRNKAQLDVEGKVTALNTSNQVRGAMWAD